MSTTKNIGIVGAGLSGRLLAWRLLRQGHSVTLFDNSDRSGKNSAGWIAAAMLAPFSERVVSESAIFHQGRASLALWPQWLGELETDSGIAVSFQQQGSVVVSHTQDEGDFQRFHQQLMQCIRGEAQASEEQAFEGQTSEGSRSENPSFEEQIQTLNQQQLAQLEPSLGERFQRGLWLQGEGCLDNRALYQGLQIAIENRYGAWFENIEVTGVAPFEVEALGQVHHFDQVVDCRGNGAKKDLTDFRGVRGEVLWVQAPEVSLSRPVRLMHPRYQLYIAPKPNNVFVIGATEIESESMAPVTVRSSLELLSALYSVDKGFGEALVLEASSHCRPAFMSHQPKLLHTEGLLRLNGLYRHGYLLSPVVVSEAQALIAGEALTQWPEIAEMLDTVESGAVAASTEEQATGAPSPC